MLTNTIDWVTYTTAVYFSHSLEARRPRSGSWHGQVLVKALFPLCYRLAVSLCGWERKQRGEALPGLIRATILSNGLHPNYLSKAPSPNTITLGIRVSACELESGGAADADVQSAAEAESPGGLFHVVQKPGTVC